MKKFLSICLVALCSASAMYAESEVQDSRTGVSCGTEVTVEANSLNGYYHLKEWKIENGTTVLETVAKNTTSPSTTYGATTSATVNSTSGIETGTLTLSELSSDLITAATSGTVTFEAIFEIDSYKITSTTEGDGSVTITGVDNNGNATGEASVTLTATADPQVPCAVFDHWEAVGNPNDPNNGSTSASLSFTTPATWEHGSTHTYKAVFKTKTININVKSDTSMGTVSITLPTSAGN